MKIESLLTNFLFKKYGTWRFLNMYMFKSFTEKVVIFFLPGYLLLPVSFEYFLNHL